MLDLRRSHLTGPPIPGNSCLASHAPALHWSFQPLVTMPFPLPPRRESLEVAETLAIAAAGGIAFTLIGVPAGLVSGSILAVACAALAGRPVKVPLPLARVCFVLVGMLLGAVVTPATLRGVVTWPLSIALLTLSAAATIVATTSYLRLAHRWDFL